MEYKYAHKSEREKMKYGRKPTENLGVMRKKNALNFEEYDDALSFDDTYR